MSLLPLHEPLKALLGNNLCAVVAFGSYTRPEDATPLSELNVLILVRRRVPPDVRGLISEVLGPQVSTLVLDVESFKRLAEEGEYLAHEVLRSGRVLYSEREFDEILKVDPPVNERTKQYLRRHALACIALSLENLLAGRPLWSVNYAYKALRSAARYYSSASGKLPFSDDEVFESIVNQADAATAFVRVKEARRRGAHVLELLDLLSDVYNASLKLLGLHSVDWGGVLQKLKGCYVASVSLEEERGALHLSASGVDTEKRPFEMRIELCRAQTPWRT
uniref:Nucleotidyltransferase domain-containing protein n=1 Tax=Thermofilum pendens TaxID=2269 RepID=A0A7J3X9D7_THEPE